MTIQDLQLERGPTRVRLGNRPDACNPGGPTLFGSSFGNYQQDLVLRLAYDHLSTPEGETQDAKGGEEKSALEPFMTANPLIRP